MKVIAPQDCDNAPKRRIIRDLNIAFAKGDVKALSEQFHKDIEWEMIGDKTISGFDAVVEYLEKIKSSKANSLELIQIISHGKHAAASGILCFNTEKIAFHDFYEFSSAGSDKVKRISSMAISI